MNRIEPGGAYDYALDIADDPRCLAVGIACSPTDVVVTGIAKRDEHGHALTPAGLVAEYGDNPQLLRYARNLAAIAAAATAHRLLRDTTTP